MKLVLWLSVIITCLSTNYTSNYNSSRVNDAHSGDAISLPIILSSTTEQKTQAPLMQTYNLRKFELKDTNYTPELSKLTQVEEQILYQNQPPLSVFDINRITLEDYQLLEVKEFRVVLINPTSKFRFCVHEIYADAVQVKRVQHKRLPFCLNSTTKYPFYFNLYITEHKPLIFRTSIYFIISVYDGEQLVEEKIWPREVVVKVNHNHLRLVPLEAKNCGKNNTQLTIFNPQSHHIKIMLDYEEDGGCRACKGYKEVIIPPHKNFKLSINPHQSTISITTKVNDYPDIILPKLFMPIYCLQPLSIHHFQIGILNSDRSIVEVPIPVSNNAAEPLLLHDISAESSSQTVELLGMQDSKERVEPDARHALICRLLLHPNKYLTERTKVNVKVRYSMKSAGDVMLEAKATFYFHEFKNPLSLGTKRFIDATKLSEGDSDPVLDNIFPVRNNLNIPIMLARVLFDEKKFKLSWLQDRRQYIYPSQMREEFALQYIGSRKLPISPTKFLVTLQFNGNLYMPIEIVIYDHTLQCYYNNIQHRCSEMSSIDFGYFRNHQTRSKQLVIRNWNPVPKDLKLTVNANLIDEFGMNCTIRLYGPFPNYEQYTRYDGDDLYYHLKGNHFIIMNFALTPLMNATTGDTEFIITTQNQQIKKKVKFKFQNGTIAILPQIIRIHSAYEKSVEYLNLVSTYSEPYKIKSTSSNVSNLDVFYNNHTEIQENQWVGLALMYTPFTRMNLTETCCGNDYAITMYITSLYVFEFKRFTYAGVKIITTNDLEVNATVIIDNKAPKILQQEAISINLIQANKPDHYQLSFQNFFSEPMKLRLVMVPGYLFENAKLYMSTMRKARKIQEELMFCANSRIQQKHNLSPQLLKSIFSLESTVNQITIEPLQNDEYYIRGKGKSYQQSGNDISPYVRKMVGEEISNCYEIEASKYIKQLIEIEILNEIGEKHSSEILLQFVEREMEYFNSPTHFLFYDQFYDTLGIDLEGYCDKTTFPLFRFCKHVNILVNPIEEVVIRPNQSLTTKVGIMENTKTEPEYQFYLALLNNITKYETHQVNVRVSEPKMTISEVYLEDDSVVSKEEFEEHYFKESDWSSVLKFEGEELGRERLRVLPIFVTTADNINSSFMGERSFNLKNTGSVKLSISHIGFNNIQRICSYQGLEIQGGVCAQGFVLEPGESKRLTIHFQFSHSQNINHILTRKIYFYNEENYYFRMTAAVRFSDPNKRFYSYRKSINSLFLNIISFIFLIYVIWNLKKQSDIKQKQACNKIKMKNRILSTSNYSQLGTGIERKPRRLETIPIEQITAVKEEKRLKDIFNSSGESDIVTKNQNEEENSSNQIINEKQEKVNVSVSEDSSLELQFQGINKSQEAEEVQSENYDLDQLQGDYVDFPSVYDGSFNMDNTIGWDDEKKESPEDKDFYDPFSCENPLTKKKEEEKKEKHSWKQDFKKNQ